MSKKIISTILLVSYFFFSFSVIPHTAFAKKDLNVAPSDVPLQTEKQDEQVSVEPAKEQTPPSQEAVAKQNKLDKKIIKDSLKTQPILNPKKLPMATVLGVFSTSLSNVELEEMAQAFRRELKNSGKYLVYSKEEMKKVASKNLSEDLAAMKKLDQLLSEAKKFNDDLKSDAALAVASEAIKSAGNLDASPSVLSKVTEAYLAKAVAYDTLDKKQDSYQALLNAAALSPNFILDASQYGPQTQENFARAKKEFLSIKKASLRIESNPPVAEVYIDDKRVGTTPLTVENLALGPQKVRLQKAGYETWEKNIMVVGASSEDYSNKTYFSLSKTGEFLSLDALIGEVITRKDYDSQISKIGDLGKLLMSQIVFLARVEKNGNNFDLFTSMVDATTGKELASSYRLLDSNFANFDIALLAAIADMSQGKEASKKTSLLAVEGKGGKYAHSYKKQKPFYKTWPFYVIIGAVLVGGGTGAALALTKKDTTGSALVTGVSAQP